MSKIKKYFFALISLVLMIVLTVYVCCFAIKKAKNYKIYSEPSTVTKIYTIWHIETFEGGGKARINYLKSVAKIIEKENLGILFHIQQIKPENLQNELNLSTPEIISFGFGVGKVVLPYLINLNNTFDVRDELAESSMFNNLVYALPYIVGGYAEIKHNELATDFYCGTSNYINPQKIYSQQNLKPKNNESCFEAYKHFVNNKNSFMLGTSRDVYRVNNLNNIGRTNAVIKPINTYTDLIQYIGITKQDIVTNKFVELSLNVSNQYQLTTYYLFSSLNNKIYNSGIYNDMENAIFSCKIPNVFND